MAAMIFWEKRGCLGNARQKSLLRASGHALDVRDLRDEAWTPEQLRPFFGDRPVAAWFNPRAPRLVRGEVRPETLDETAALTLLIAEPLLIRRPLLAIGDARECGFDADRIATLTGVPMAGEADEACPRDAVGGACR